MELVYPIYLDIPMMTGFLASIEGGIVEEAEIESKSGDVKEKSTSASLKASISGMVSSILGAGLNTGLDSSRKISENLESSYKGVIRYPTSALFIRLRNLLIQQDIIKVVTDKQELETVGLGDIVEFGGFVSGNPAYQIRHAFGQLLPILMASYKLNDAQFDQEIAQLENVKAGSTISVLGEEITIQSKKHATSLQAVIRSQQQIKKSEVNLYETMGEILEGLFSQDGRDILHFDMMDWQAICRVYPTFVRNERVHEIHDANWRCVGKVIGFIPDGESYDLLQGSPIGYLAKEQFSELASSLTSDDINIQVNDPLVAGPAIVVAAMAIFS